MVDDKPVPIRADGNQLWTHCNHCGVWHYYSIEYDQHNDLTTDPAKL